MAAQDKANSDTVTLEKLEKLEVTPNSPQPDKKNRRSFFKRHSKGSDNEEVNEKDGEAANAEAQASSVKTVHPVNFTALFRCAIHRLSLHHFPNS